MSSKIILCFLKFSLCPINFFLLMLLRYETYIWSTTMKFTNVSSYEFLNIVYLSTVSPLLHEK